MPKKLRQDNPPIEPEAFPGEDSPQRFRSLVREIMVERGWDKARLARETGLQYAVVHRILKEKSPSRLHEGHVSAICKALKIRVRFGYKREIKTETVWY